MRFLPVANPEGPFSASTLDYDVAEAPGAELQVFEDHARSILSQNDSPDVGFRWSVNPYRGCLHACAYCYARPSHEYLSFGAGTDFERKIVVKPRAPELLREAFDRRSWKGELVVFSGITDCYQPLEAQMKLTRGCIEACVDYRNPAGFITKSPIIERDVELLAELSRVASCRVSVSVPFWDPAVARAMEPYVTTPARRMKIVHALARAGVPVGVSVSPIIPGLNDGDVPSILEAARDAGARHAFFVMLRLPGSVRPVFEAALRERVPLRAEKVLRRLREMHGGALYDARFGHRGRGEGEYAASVRLLFEQTARRLGLIADGPSTDDVPTTFRRPYRSGQTSFGFEGPCPSGAPRRARAPARGRA